jgi:outer membrane beta-barrel protein
MAVILALLVFIAEGKTQIEPGSCDLSAFVGFAKGMDTEIKIRVEGEAETRTVTNEGGSDFMFGARYNYNFSKNNSLEGTAGFIFPEGGKLYFYNANYRYNISAGDELVVPFFTVGAGAVTVAPDQGDSETYLTINFGGGVGFFLSDKLAFRVDVRDYVIRVGEQTGDVDGTTVTAESHSEQILEFSGGITFYF